MQASLRTIVMFLGLTLVVPTMAPAGEMPFIYKGIRPLGMGNTFLTMADDGNALFYNPAGLNGIQGFGELDLLNLQVELSQVALDAVSDFKDIDSNNVSEVTTTLEKYVGDRFHLRTALFPHMVMHNFGVGVLGQATIDGDVRNRVNPEMSIDGKVDLGGVIGLAYGFMEKRLQIGISGKFVQRESYTKTYLATDIAAPGFDPAQDFKDDRTSGSGIGIDLGALYQLPAVRFYPTLGLVIQNIGDLDLGDAGTLAQQVNAGVAIHPDFWILKTTLALEVNDLLKNVDAEEDFYKRVHMGGELRFPYILSLRAGFNQGYRSFGATIDLWILQIQYANYKEEIGVVAGQREDERQVVQLVLGF